MSKKPFKRKSTETSPSSKRTRKDSRELSAFFKSYKNGIGDFHLPLFRAVAELLKPERVLYPGCYRHVTASLTFDDVVYVDCDSIVGNCFQDECVLDWLDQNKDYIGKTKLKFICANFDHDIKSESPRTFDLAISACAGIVTSSTEKYLKIGGYYLVSDAHYDARCLSLDKSFTLKYVWDSESETFTEDVEGHFVTKEGEQVTREMVEESKKKPKARRSFKLKKEAMFYLFVKTE